MTDSLFFLTIVLASTLSHIIGGKADFFWYGFST